MGQRFTVDGLSALRSQTEGALKPKLDSLARRELLVFDADPRSPERGQFGFTQGVIREIAYASLPKRDRRARHERAAVYLEGLADPEFAGIIASHYLAAYQASPAGPEAEARVEELSAAGLLARGDDGTEVRVTEAGARLHGRIRETVVEITGRLWGDLSAEDL